VALSARSAAASKAPRCRARQDRGVE
jgi:hypothetical protein